MLQTRRRGVGRRGSFGTPPPKSSPPARPPSARLYTRGRSSCSLYRGPLPVTFGHAAFFGSRVLVGDGEGGGGEACADRVQADLPEGEWPPIARSFSSTAPGCLHGESSRRRSEGQQTQQHLVSTHAKLRDNRRRARAVREEEEKAVPSSVAEIRGSWVWGELSFDSPVLERPARRRGWSLLLPEEGLEMQCSGRRRLRARLGSV